MIHLRKETRTKMKKIDVKVRGVYEGIDIGQLYAVINGDNDIHVNGSITVKKEATDKQNIRIYANLLDKDEHILYVLSSYRSISLKKGSYKSFSMYCAKIERFLPMDELDCIEIYGVYNEKDCD